MRKLAIVCLPGLDNFLQWTEKIVCFEVRIFLVKTEQDIQEAVAWGDIVFFEWANESAIHGIPIAKSAGKPVVLRLHSYEALSGFAQEIPWNDVDRVVFVAEHMIDITERLVPGIRYLNPFVIQNGIDIENIPELNPGPGFEIASVGGISHKKNPALMLQILESLCNINPKYRVHIAGGFQELRYEIYLKHMVHEMGLENNVIFYGHVEDMNDFYRGKNYLLHTSVHEGHCVSIIEAMARGIKPVIHNFCGASYQYPEHMLFNTITEAIGIIRGEYKNSYREYVINSEWTITDQADKIQDDVLYGL
jgi:glycosyltransferase involved in cell wall biosynthesis